MDVNASGAMEVIPWLANLNQPPAKPAQLVSSVPSAVHPSGSAPEGAGLDQSTRRRSGTSRSAIGARCTQAGQWQGATVVEGGLDATSEPGTWVG